MASSSTPTCKRRAEASDRTRADGCPMESFWGSMQIELLNGQKWRTNLGLAVARAEYIEHFYNSERRYSSLGYLTPNEFEDLPVGGDDGTRTHDPLLAKQVL
jgi:transposase InsO family protein